MKSAKLPLLLTLGALILSACNTSISSLDNSSTSENPNNKYPGPNFTYSGESFEPILGTLTNDETFDYEDIIVNPVANIRDDFAMGVDASMVKTVEENGGVYYNKEGVEQDVFQIMAQEGVNFFRVRIWNAPYNLLDDPYGGGSVDVREAISMSKRAQAAGMNVMVDLHYSDFWADPEKQRTPTSWSSKNQNELEQAVEQFTSQTLNSFKNEGVNVQAIQIGNEINNGMLYPIGKIDWGNKEESFIVLSNLIKAGIRGAKASMPDIYSVIHLANGGSWDEFRSFFNELEDNDVPYDIIGASYYPYYHGSLEALQNNLNNIAETFNKSVIVAEMSYGFTNDYTANTANIYNVEMEEAGKYKTSVQGQATAIHDVVKIIADVPNNRGLGIFYWEPAWLPVENASWATAEGQAWIEYGDANDYENVSQFNDGLATWSNQALFSYTGKMLPSLQTFSLLREDRVSVTEVAVNVRSESIEVTLNAANNETLPDKYYVETNLDSVRLMPVVWDLEQVDLSQPGEYVVDGLVVEKFAVTANVRVIQNFVQDPGFENQSTQGDNLGNPWLASSDTHASPHDVLRLNRKAQDVRTGNADLNWYHSRDTFHFKASQEITLTEAGVYSLKAYVMAVAPNDIAHEQLDIFVTLPGGTTLRVDMKNEVQGWGTAMQFYKEALIANIEVEANQTISIGIEGRALPGAWGHVDDFELIKLEAK